MSTLITGYYRFTDIVFEWHKKLPNPEDIGSLKALLANDALVHPDHPLHKPGQDGIELFHGVFKTGEARLMFSSAQIEYLRYYLHAMKLTTRPIPLPASDWLLKMSDLKSCAPALYNNAATLKKAVKDIDKANRRLKGMGGANSSLGFKRLTFECARAIWAEKIGTWLAVDFESWERDHTLLTEYGWSMARWDADANEQSSTGHLIIKERLSLKNSTFVKGNRDHYDFGESEIVDKVTFKNRICGMIKAAQDHGPLFLVFHDASQDLKDMRSRAVDAPLENLQHVLPHVKPTEGTYVVDTTDLFGALMGDIGGEKRGLKQMCNQLKIPIQRLHNAGNDASYTMLALQSMMNGGPLDTQRQQRWPVHLACGGLAVELPDPYNKGPGFYEDVPTSMNTVEAAPVDEGAMDTE